MKLTDSKNQQENWHEVLSLWNLVANWSHYRLSDGEIKQKLKSLVIFLWNEKDWLAKEYPEKCQLIEDNINKSKFIKIIADLANSIKHRRLDKKPRSNANQSDYYGRITLNQNSGRNMYYIECNGEVLELFAILRGSMDEYEKIKTQLMR